MSTTVIEMVTSTKKWKKCLVDLSEKLTPPEPLLTQEESGNVLLYRRGLHIVSGKQKAGKTFYSTILMTSLTNQKGVLYGFVPSSTQLKVLFVDTEQDISDTQEVIKRVHRLNKWLENKNKPQLKALNLREYAPAERTEIVEEALDDYRPDVIIIDGVVDLCLDFNSLEESHALVTKLLQWATKYNVSIVTALHTNKNNDELRGHLGSFLAQKCESVIRISKDSDGIPFISCTIIDSRHKPIDDFSFRIEDGLPQLYDPIKTSRPPIDYDSIFDNVLKEKMRYTELVEAVAKYTNKSTSTAKNYIKLADERNIINQNNGLYDYANRLPF